jgi:hypothetical protein
VAHTEPEPPRRPLDTSGTNDEESGAPDFFPPVGNFNAVVPLSELDGDSESPMTAPAPAPMPQSSLVSAAVKERAHDEQEEATLVPARAARMREALRPAARRPSWPVMIAVLALSLMTGLAAGVYLIKSVRPVEIQAPASMTEGAAHDAAGAAETSGPQPTQVASDSRPEAKPQAETNEVRPQAETGLDAVASAVKDDVRDEKTSRDLTAPKRVKEADAPSGREERALEKSPAKASVAERTPERPARKAPPLKTDTPAPTEALRTRRATSVSERPPVLRAPERSLPVSSPPSSTKSKRVLQWP